MNAHLTKTEAAGEIALGRAQRADLVQHRSERGALAPQKRKDLLNVARDLTPMRRKLGVTLVPVA